MENRDSILQGGRPHAGVQSMLRACDQQLRAVSWNLREIFAEYLLIERQEIATVTDDTIYAELRASDQTMGRWTAEDPSLRSVQRWIRARRP